MRIWSYNCFIPVVAVLFVGLSSYGIIGLFLNGWELENGSFHGIWPLNEKCGLVVLMVVQGILLTTTLIGLIGFICCRSVVIGYVPGFLLLGAGVSLIAFGGFTLRESTKDFRHDFLTAFLKVNASAVAEDYLTWISGIQWEHDCCGIISYKDFLQFKFPTLQWQSVPETCCQRATKIPEPNCGHGILVPEKSVEEVEAVLLPNGCGRIMSKIQSGKLFKMGTEMLVVGLLSVGLAIFIYIGIFKIVAAEYQMGEGEDEPGSDDVRDGLSQDASSTITANTSTNTTTAGGTLRNPAQHRRIFRTRRHGGGESIVSFAVDLENNNIVETGGSSSASSHGHKLKGQGGQGGKWRNRTQYTRQGQTLLFVNKSKGPQPGKCQGRRQGNHPKETTARPYCPQNSREQLEMLLHPRDNHSIASTTTYPSSQNFLTYFRQNQAGPSRSTDSDTNMSMTAGGGVLVRTQTLTHYSSLPHVNPVTMNPGAGFKNDDPKSKAMAELKVRFPPAGIQTPGRNHAKSVPPPPPPATSQTQHHHYYRIPSSTRAHEVNPPPPLFVDGKFPSVLIEAAESVLDTIQEEGESGRSTIVHQQSPQSAMDRVSIFEVFGEALGASLEAVVNENTQGHEKVEECQGEFGGVENCESDMSHGSGSGCLDIKEESDKSGVHLLDTKNKIEMEPMDALVYFQV